MECEIAFMRVKKRPKEFYDFNYIFNIIDVVLIRSVNSNYQGFPGTSRQEGANYEIFRKIKWLIDNRI